MSNMNSFVFRPNKKNKNKIFVSGKQVTPPPSPWGKRGRNIGFGSFVCVCVCFFANGSCSV